MEDSNEEEDINSIEDDGDFDAAGIEGMSRRKIAGLTGRGVTMSVLMTEGIIEPGDGVLSMDYLGKNFMGDLLTNGKIRAQQQIFNSPSAWAICCKKLVNPSKKSGCGWASVKYKGKKLDQYKSIWYRKQHSNMLNSNPSTPISSVKDQGWRPSLPITGRALNGSSITSKNGLGSKSLSKTKNSDLHSFERTEKHKRKSSSSLMQSSDLIKKLPSSSLSSTLLSERKPKEPIRYSTLGEEGDASTIVYCEKYSSQNRKQPFSVSIYTNCLLLMEFHSHLTTSEVVGYLGGMWDPNSKHLCVQQAFSCQCRLGDKENAATVEGQVRNLMESQGLSLVGWYHSHPFGPAEPSLGDIQSQLSYQTQLEGVLGQSHPCVAIIAGPYCQAAAVQPAQSALRAFMVQPPPQESSVKYGMPMRVEFRKQPDLFISPDVLMELKCLTDFYKNFPDMIRFSDQWHSSSFFDKLQVSLSPYLPNNTSNVLFIEYIRSLLATVV